MDKDKSILEKFTDTVKDIANSASEALKAEEPPKVETNAAYVPFAAEGLVSDPLLLPPVAVQPKRRVRAAKKTAEKASARKATAQRAAPKKARKTVKAPARRKSKARSRSAAKASAKRTARRTTKRRTAKRSSKRSRR
jgi:hypothetical protein